MSSIQIMPPRTRVTFACCAAGLLLLVVVGGCSNGGVEVDPQVLAEHRAKLLLDNEPEGALAVLDVRELFVPAVDEEHALADGEELHGDIEGGGDELEFTESDFEPEPPASEAVSQEPRQVVVVGRVGGIPNPFGEAEPLFPWKENLAAFFLVDPGTVAEMEEAGHAHGEVCDCPFCARSAADKITSVAVVNFNDSDGQPIEIPAHKLLDLKQAETVVVQGQARLMGGELLLIDADGIYIRR